MTTEAQLLAERIYRTFETPVIITDLRLRLLAFSEQPDDHTDAARRDGILRLSGPAVIAWLNGFLEGQEEQIRVPPNPELGTLARTVVIVRHRGYPVGRIYVLDPDRVVPDTWSTDNAEALAALALEIELSRSRASQTQQAIRSIVGTSLEERQIAVDHLMTFRCFQESDEFRVVTIKASRPVADVSAMVWDDALGGRGAWGVVDDRLVMVINAPDQIVRSVVERARRRLSEGHAAALTGVGIGGGVLGLDSARTSFLESLKALRVRELSNDEVVNWDTLGPWRILLSLNRDQALRAVDTRALRLVRSERQSDIEVLHGYLDRSGDIKGLAEELHLHRSTVYSRLRRLEKRYGFDLSLADDRTCLSLGLRLILLHRLD